MEKIVFISGKRTPFGAFGGSLKEVSARDLSVAAAKATLEQAQLSGEKVEHLILGNVVQSGADAAYIPKHIALKTGLPMAAPA